MVTGDVDFLGLMKAEGVTPKVSDGKALVNPRHKKAINAKARQLSAMGGEKVGLTTKSAEILDPFEPLEWKREGIQDGVFRNVRLGKYQIDARLDLLKKRPEQALDELLSFIPECSELGIRYILITHGRAHQADAPANILRSFLNTWLPDLAQVMAFHSAQPQHGGLAATYVMLRKNEEQRQANWERHQKR